jgi:hypothetical protein
MTRLQTTRGALVALLVVFQGLTPCDSSADLTRKQTNILETEFLPAYDRGNTLGVLQSLSAVVGSMTENQMDELDGLLAARQLPNSSQLLVESRLTLLQQDPGRRLPRPGLRELVLMISHIDGEIKAVLDAANGQVLEIDNLSSDETFNRYESLLWEAHVLGQKLNSANSLARYAQQTMKSKHRYRFDDLDQPQRDLMNTDFSQLEKEIRAAQVELSERVLMARIKRLQHSADVLQNSDKLKEHYLASWSIDIDGDLIRQELVGVSNRKNKGKSKSGTDTPRFNTEYLNDDTLAEEIDGLITDGRDLAGEALLVKSRLLFTGLHWWMRGRYGMGTDGFGLLKSEDALASAEASFALYMPEVTPKPTDPRDSSRYQIPEIDRRHNYIWAWEYRSLGFESSTNSSVRVNSYQNTQEVTMSRFY